MKKLIFGCGYLGARVAQAWINRGDEVFAVTRSAERAAALQEQGIRPLIGELTGELDLTSCEDVGTVLFAVGFDRTGAESIHDVYVGGLQNVLNGLPTSLGRFIYISSTGVYSQSAGEWVDEDSVCEPTREGGKACLAAEQLLTGSEIGARSIILRLAGIYGPGRLPKLPDVLAGNPIASNSEGYLNLIHIDDAVQAVLAAEERIVPPDLLVVSDGAPITRGEFYRELAKLCDAPAPRFAPPHNDTTAQRASTDKRIDNQQMRERLAIELKHPTYKQGLAAIVGQQKRESDRTEP
jgi:nucleoside-diphosphate-sugar epimerase